MPAPLVAVIMGSKSDWDTMSHAAAVLDEFAVPYAQAGRLGAPHARRGWRSSPQGAEGRGPEGDHRRRRRRRPPPGHGRRPHHAAGARRAGAERRAARPRLAALDRADARRRAGGHAGHRQAGRQERRPARRRDSRHGAARAGARASGPSARSRPARCGKTACREPRSCFPAPRSACSAADSSDGCSRSRRGGWATACTRCRPASTRRPARWPTSKSTPTTTTSTRSAPSPAAWTSSPSSSRTCPPPPPTPPPRSCRCGPAATPCTSPSSAPARRRSCA